MPINTAGAKAILDIITTHPALYDQDEWFTANTDDNNGMQEAAEQGLTATALLELDKLHNDGAHNTCGTTFCVAGWGTMLSGYTLYRMPLGKFTKRFGTDLVAEMFAENQDIVSHATAADYSALDRSNGEHSMSFYRDPNGQWLHNGYGPTLPPFAEIGARFLGLTTPHGAYVAGRLFRGDADRDEVVEALTALAQNRYPEVLVKPDLDQVEALLNACLDGQYSLQSPTAAHLIHESEEDAAAHGRAMEELNSTVRKAKAAASQMAHNLRQMRRVYTLSNLTEPAPQAADLTAIINV